MTVSDEELLRAIADLCTDTDPSPADLADGVLARLAVQGLETEFELFTLVHPLDTRLGTRFDAEPETSSTVALEFAGSTYRVLVRIADTDTDNDTDTDGRRLDGWVVPALPMRVFLGPPGDAPTDVRQSAYADREGRFEFPRAVRGEVRLWLLPQGTRRDGASPPPFVTPPFLV